MFAGCGSEWKNPCRKTIVIHVSAIRYAMSRRSSGSIASRSSSETFVPCRNSSVRTRAVEYVRMTRGTTTRGSPAKLRWNASAFRASWP